MGLLSCLLLALELIEYQSSADPGQMANCGTYQHTNAHVGLQVLSAWQISVPESMLASGLLSLYPSCSLLHPLYPCLLLWPCSVYHLVSLLWTISEDLSRHFLSLAASAREDLLKRTEMV